MSLRSFGSDNHSGVHPKVLSAIAEANQDHAHSYGLDPWTKKAQDLFKAEFGSEAVGHVVFSGTGSNVLGMASALKPFQAVVCSATAHIQTSETGAPERFLGSKLLLVPPDLKDGKIRVTDLEKVFKETGNIHHVQPKLVSISQGSEVGTVYRPEEVREISKFCKKHSAVFHMDGARLMNAAASLGLSLREMTTDLGVDILSFGGTKNGALCAESVIFLNPALSDGFEFLRKQGMQLASKQRYLSAQWIALLEKGFWRELAAHSNQMAKKVLAGILKRVPDGKPAHPTDMNAVFLEAPLDVLERARAKVPFHLWTESPAGPGRAVGRIMASWDTTEKDVEALFKSFDA
ncbi:MAG: aminotransferase class V-fold PLP-dependent enzyme [Bdellovibrionales bacterium]|nr:aminotransferase class V-fold PLP-dependent enzyme [Bdellovibrionales bacterium]